MTAFALGAKCGGRAFKSYTRGPFSTLAACRTSAPNSDARAAPCRPLPTREKKSLRDNSCCIISSIDIRKFGRVQQLMTEAGERRPFCRRSPRRFVVLVFQI